MEDKENVSNKDKLLEEYKAEMIRHQKAVSDIMRKYIPGYGEEVDRR